MITYIWFPLYNERYGRWGFVNLIHRLLYITQKRYEIFMEVVKTEMTHLLRVIIKNLQLKKCLTFRNINLHMSSMIGIATDQITGKRKKAL